MLSCTSALFSALIANTPTVPCASPDMPSTNAHGAPEDAATQPAVSKELPANALSLASIWYFFYFFNFHSSSPCAIPETGVGSSPRIPVLSVCFSCIYTGIRDLLFNAGSERLVSE